MKAKPSLKFQYAGTWGREGQREGQPSRLISETGDEVLLNETSDQQNPPGREVPPRSEEGGHVPGHA